MLHVIINDNLSDPYGEGLFEPNARRTFKIQNRTQYQIAKARLLQCRRPISTTGCLDVSKIMNKQSINCSFFMQISISAHSSKKIPGSVNSGPLTQSTHFLKNLSNSCILESFSSFYSSRWHYPLIWIPVACYQQNLFKTKRARQVNG